MAEGLNRHNDFPIGGRPEFRGNMQGGEVFGVDDVPVWDGAKFSPGTNSALLNAYGGLVTTLSAGHIADGSILDFWDAVTPLGGVPLQTTPVAATGVITTAISGTWEIKFECNVAGLTNNQDYFFQLTAPSGDTGFGTHVVGSNNVSSQSTGFVITLTAPAGAVAVVVSNSGNNPFDIVSGTLSVNRIG